MSGFNNLFFVVFCAMFMGLTACEQQSHTSGNKPILLGDSSTIVTEPDARYLKDIVVDLKADNSASKEPAATVKDSIKVKPADTSTKAPNTSNAANGAGLVIQFAECKFTIPGLKCNKSSKQDESKASGVIYNYQDGNINGNSIVISGAVVEKISQHYQSIVVLKSNLGNLALDNINTITDWEEIKGQNGSYTINGLAGKLVAPQFNMNALQKAILKAGKRKHLSKSVIQKWQAQVRNTSNNKKVINTVMRYVVWKLQVKSPSGKDVTKMVRINFPDPG